MRRKEGIWSRSGLGSQRCTRSRPAQRTCRPLAVGAAPGMGSLGTSEILFMAALVAGASLLAAVESFNSSVAGAAALVSSSSVTWMVGSCQETNRKFSACSNKG